MGDMDALRESDPRHYDDRRAHLVALGATDAQIQHWVQVAVDHGIAPAEFLSKIEGFAARIGCTLEASARETLAGYRRQF